MVHRRYRKHEIIWGEGECAVFFAIIVSGAVKLVKNLADGRQQIVAMLFASDCLGTPFSGEQTAYAEAATDTELCCFPRREFERALEQNPELERALLEKTFHDLAKARDWLVTIGRLSAGERLASFLVSMMERSIRSVCKNMPTKVGNPVFEIPMSRAEIADYLGLTIETVSRHFSRLSNAGIISIRDARTIEVSDARTLCKLAGRQIETARSDSAQLS